MKKLALTALMALFFGTALADTVSITINENTKKRQSVIKNKYLSVYKLEQGSEKMKMLDEIIALVLADSILGANQATVTNVVTITNYVNVIDSFGHRRDRDRDIKPKSPEAMPNDDFGKLVDTISGTTFKDDKFRVIEASAGGNYFSMDQIIRLMKMWTFDDDKLRVLQATYPKATDKNNSYKLYDQVEFISSKDKIKAIVEDNK